VGFSDSSKPLHYLGFFSPDPHRAMDVCCFCRTRESPPPHDGRRRRRRYEGVGRCRCFGPATYYGEYPK
jgi:hypothetical protein